MAKRNYKKEYKKLLNEIGEKCELVLMGLSPPTECKSKDCRFGDPSSTGGLGEDVCCPDSWKDPDVINVDLPEIQMALAKELGPVWKSTSASGTPDNSSLSHFSAMTRPSWLGRAARNRHRPAIEQASRRWRGGR